VQAWRAWGTGQGNSAVCLAQEIEKGPCNAETRSHACNHLYLCSFMPAMYGNMFTALEIGSPNPPGISKKEIVYEAR